jgi:hypothetical protein
MRDRRIVRKCCKCDKPCISGSGQRFCAEHKITLDGGSNAPINQRARKYGITVDEIVRMEEEQEGLCAICRNPEPIEGRSLCVDHDHDTLQVRSLLCSNCNRGIGFLQDSVLLLERAAEYLKAHGKKW